MLTLTLIFCISLLQYGLTQAIISNLSGFEFWIAILFDSASLEFPFICFGVYPQLPHQVVEMLAGMPFLFMIFFSTTFSPGSGVAVVKELRYLFSRFYLLCMTPYVDHLMGGCPADDGVNLFLLVLTGCLSAFVFIVIMAAVHFSRRAQRKKQSKKTKSVRRSKRTVPPTLSARSQNKRKPRSERAGAFY